MTRGNAAGADRGSARPASYDRNGNRKADERGGYEFNARDQVTKWNRGEGAESSGAVSYELNGSGSMTFQSDTANGGSQTSYTYDGDRLMESSTSGGSGSSSTSSFAYDDFGSTTSISGGAGGGSTGAGQDRSYDYSSDMERLGQASGDGADSAYHAPARRRRCAP